MEDKDVEEGDCLGVSFGDPATDEPCEAALLLVAIRVGTAVDAMVCMIDLSFNWYIRFLGACLAGRAT